MNEILNSKKELQEDAARDRSTKEGVYLNNPDFYETRRQKLIQLVSEMDVHELDVLNGIISISLIAEGDSALNGAPCRLRKRVPLFDGDTYL